MPDEPNFMDLVTLLRVKPDSTVERFGSAINSSFFDASNVLGTLKQKGLIDFTTIFGSQNAITLTDLGKQLINEAEMKAPTLFDHLDLEILNQLSGGKRSITDISGAVNVRPKDLALHLYKMSAQQYLDYEISSGKLSIMLTEKGFMQVKQGMPVQPEQEQNKAAPPQQGAPPVAPQVVQHSAQPQQMPQPMPQQVQQSKPQEVRPAGAAKHDEFPELEDLEKKIKADKNRRKRKTFSIIAIVIIIIVLLLLFSRGII